MQSKCMLHVFFVLSLYILCKAHYVIGSGPSCVRSSPAGLGQTRITFLREDATGVRSLYVSLWSEDTRQVTCQVNTNPIVTDRYFSICDRSSTQSREVLQRFNTSMLLSPDSPCKSASSSVPKFIKRTRRDVAKGKVVRRKRAWIFPGTLWCGTGSMADEYEQLGMFESADRCCREHDHCLHVIPAFTGNYGVFNSNFFTVSHCDCDQRFRQCLLGVNDTISSMVGYSFFNILQVPCFDLTQQRRCTEWYWWGMCKVANMAPSAVMKRPVPYADVTSNNNATDSNMVANSKDKLITESFVINPLKKLPKSERRCKSRQRPRGKSFYRMKGEGCKRHQKMNTTTPSQKPSVSRVSTTSLSMKVSLLNETKSTAAMPIKKRLGKKKSNSKGLSDYVTLRSQIPPQANTSSYKRTASTTQSPPSATATPAVRKSPQKVPKQRRCCGLRTSLRGDTFQPRCKGCLEQKAASGMTDVTHSTTTYIVPVKTSTNTTRILTQTETPRQDKTKKLWSAATSANSILKEVKPQKQMESPLQQNDTNQEPTGTNARRSLKQNVASQNMTDNQVLCGSLKHLDQCKYSILPLENKYNLQNMKSKTAYHCDCTSRLAVRIESFNQPSILPRLLMDFVSQSCFNLPNEKKCHRRKSCSGGFSKASDLLQALSMMEERDTTVVQNSANDRNRGIPTRLYKRCLRLAREADVGAQLTQL
ncbi:pla2g3 [Pungitius sinensis]